METPFGALGWTQWPGNVQHLPGYSEWPSFTATITQAKTACKISNYCISGHFVDVNKMAGLGS